MNQRKNKANLKVLIVEDEKLAREDLLNLINWEEYGFVISGIAVNGKQALKKYGEINPDILITDIKMPEMDGIELIQNIRSMNSKIKILLLTAFSDFEYAKKAISLGVNDYLLKGEFSTEELCQLLVKLKLSIEDERLESNLLFDSILNKYLISNNFDLDTSILDYNFEKLFNERFFYFIIEKYNPLPIVSGYSQKVNSLEKNEVAIILDAKSENLKIVKGAKITQFQYLLIVEDIGRYSKSVTNEYLKSYALSIKEHLNNVSVSYITSKLNMMEFKSIFEEIRKKLFNRWNPFYEDILELSNEEASLHNEEKKFDADFTDLCIRIGKKKEIFEYVNDELYKLVHPNVNYLGLVSFSKGLYAYLKNQIIGTENINLQDRLDVQKNIHKWMSYELLKEWMIEAISAYIDESEKRENQRYSKIILRTMKYISNNFHDKNISVATIADAIGLSENRISVLFKEETGITLHKIITRYRIEYAQRLLDEGKLKIYEITEKVGYNSSQYFSQLFYSYTGKTPNEYKKKN